MKKEGGAAFTRVLIPGIEWLKSQRRWASGGVLEMALVGVRGEEYTDSRLFCCILKAKAPAPSLKPIQTLAAIANP